MVTTVWSFLLVIGVLIFVHELGHFLAARRVGIRVLTFSLGFGPKILKTTRGDTEYCISLVSESDERSWPTSPAECHVEPCVSWYCSTSTESVQPSFARW